MLPLRTRVALRVQRVLAHLFFPIFGVLVVLAIRYRGYRIEEMAKVRKQFLEIARDSSGPILLCSNHMTIVDSAIIAWALASNWTYLLRFRLFPWSLPEWMNFYRNVGLRIICYLAKCVPIMREGSVEQKRASMAKLEQLLRQGDTVAIFPEGGRSRTGYLDMENFGYGAGQLWTRVPNMTVVCIYLRGLAQSEYSGVPARGDRMYVELQRIEAQSSYKGLRAARDVTRQIMDTLHQMEQRYFAQIGGPPSSTANAATAEDGDEPTTSNKNASA
jgi:1-acyl-sn-glycerol-3-phosphate acyltransferase